MSKPKPKPEQIGTAGPYDLVRETIRTDDPKVRIMPPIVLTTKK